MHPLLIIGLALTAVGLIASASDSSNQKKPRQQGGEPSPDQNPPEPQDNVTLELLEDNAPLEDVFTKLPELQKNLPAISPDMESAWQDIRAMYHKHPHDWAAAFASFALEMSWIYKGDGDDAKAAQWENIAKEAREFGKKKPH